MNKLTAIAVAFAPFVVISADGESWTLDGTEEEIPSGEVVVVNGNDQSLRLVNGAKLTVRQGATLTVEPSDGYKDGQKLFYMDGIWKDSPQVIRRPSELTIDGGTMNAPLTFWKLSDGAYLKYGILKVTNGGKFLMARPRNSPGMPSMLVEGGSGIVVDKGSTFSITGANTPEKSLILGQGGPSLEVKDKSFFNYYNIWIGGTSVFQRPATGVKVLFEDSTVTTDDQESGDCVVTFYGNTYSSADNEICITGELAKVRMNVSTVGKDANVKGNVVRLCGGELTGSFDCSVGTSNRFVQTAGKQTGAMRITGGLNNMIEMNGGESVGKGEDGAVTLTGGTGNKFVMLGGTKSAAWPNQFALGGTENEIQILGGKAGSWKGGSMLAFKQGAEGCRVLVTDGVLQLSVANKNDEIVAFEAGAKNCSLVISNDTNVGVANADDYKGVFTDGWMNFGRDCEGCTLEFVGAQPRFGASSAPYSTPDSANITFGSPDAGLSGKTVVLKYTLPSEPYKSAPLYNTSEAGVKFHPNAKIVVDEGAFDFKAAKPGLAYPLVYDVTGFHGEMTEELVGALNGNAILPDGMELFYLPESKGGTLCVRKRRKFVLFVH